MSVSLKRHAPSIVFFACLVLSACGSGEPEPSPTPTPVVATPIPTLVPQLTPNAPVALAPAVPTRSLLNVPASMEESYAKSVASPYLYRLTMTNCNFEQDRTRYQTAFKLKGVRGLLTALHGVADCDEIEAVPANSASPSYSYLKIVEADTAHDIAVLASPQSAMDLNTGFVIASDGLFRRPCGDSYPNDPHLYIFGYPAPNDKLVVSGNFLVDCIRPLQDRVPIRQLQIALEDRGIQVSAIDIFDIQDADIQHGHSGSPLLMVDASSGQLSLLGIVIGRLLNYGSDGVPIETNPNGWAVLWSDQQLLPVENISTDLQKVAGKNIFSNYSLAMMLAADPRIGRRSELHMRSGQEWSSSFTIQQMFTTQESCVAIYTRSLGSPESVRVALAEFGAGQDGSGMEVGTIWDPDPLQLASYRKFCNSLVTAASVTLHAYLVRKQQGDCSDVPLFEDRAPVTADFEVAVPPNAVNIGVCSAVE